MNYKLRLLFPKSILSRIGAGIKSGESDSRIAKSMTAGVIAASYPQIACTMLMGFLLGWALRLNHKVVQATRFPLWPLQWILMLPYLRLGEKVAGAEPLQMPLSEIAQLVFTDPLGSFAVLGVPLLHAILGWLIVSAALCPLIFYLSLSLVKRLPQRADVSVDAKT